jgi:hypothetical protein
MKFYRDNFLMLEVTCSRGRPVSTVLLAVIHILKENMFEDFDRAS